MSYKRLSTVNCGWRLVAMCEVVR